MSLMKQKWLDAARAVAIAGPGTGQRGSFRVGALLLENNRILAARHNSLKTHPALAKYTNWPFQHAESSCAIHHGLDHCRGLSLVCVRVLRDDSLTMARPCAACQSLLSDVGVKEVWYTDWNGKLNLL